MYNIPVGNFPNQTFHCTIPVNGENKDFTFFLEYNSVAGYWSMTLSDTITEQVIFSQLPMLVSYGQFWINMTYQLAYKEFGEICIISLDRNDKNSMPNADDLGTKFILCWGDNQEIISLEDGLYAS